MKASRAVPLARGVFATNLVLLGGAALLDADSLPTVIFLLIAVLGWGGVGAMIAIRAPGNPLGWLVLTAATAVAFLPFAAGYAGWGLAPGRHDLPLDDLVLWTSVLVTGPVGLGTLPLIFLVYPDGRLPSPRWRALVALDAAMVVVLAASALATGNDDLGFPAPDWIGPELTRALNALGGVLLIACAIGALASLWVRLRRAPDEERGAIRWLFVLLAAILAAAVLSALAAVVLSATGLENWLALVLGLLIVFPAVLFGIPFVLSMVLLRYGLYDYEVRMRKRILATGLTIALTCVTMLGLTLIPRALVGGAPERLSWQIAVLLGIGGTVLAIALYRGFARFAQRVVFGDRATPYEVLSVFSERIGETYGTEDVLPRMAQLLAANTGARATKVWVRVGDELRVVACWPGDAAATAPVMADGRGLAAAAPDGGSVFPVMHHGEELGALTLVAAANDPMNAEKERLAQDLAAQAGLVLRNVALIEELRESRRRIVSAQDERAHRLERDLHDGAQQQLVALSVQTQLARTMAERDPVAVPAILDRIHDAAGEALESLRDLARGIYPPVLADRGLVAALEGQLRKAAIDVEVDAGTVGRHPREVESAIYFSILEAVTNATKYAEATHVVVRIDEEPSQVRFVVHDDGGGFDPATRALGTGLQGMRDRLEAVGGSLRIDSAPGAGTTIEGNVPVAPQR
jgi:signal transduction histidine kinase